MVMASQHPVSDWLSPAAERCRRSRHKWPLNSSISSHFETINAMNCHLFSSNRYLKTWSSVFPLLSPYQVLITLFTHLIIPIIDLSTSLRDSLSPERSSTTTLPFPLFPFPTLPSLGEYLHPSQSTGIRGIDLDSHYGATPTTACFHTSAVAIKNMTKYEVTKW